MKKLVTLKVNGDTHEIAIEPRTTLLDALRNNLGLTGTKNGCSLGNCGGCTVLINGKPMLSCLTLAVEAQGKDILTVEGLAQDGQLHPLQQAFVDYVALQCGYCTPGVLMSAKALLDRNPDPSVEEVKEAISGNLCRCTGYYNIIEAILKVARSEKEGR